MTKKRQKWEYAFYPVECSDPYWNKKDSMPTVNARTAKKGGLWIDALGEQGWELVNLLPIDKPITGVPADKEVSELKNVFIGLWKRPRLDDELG